MVTYHTHVCTRLHLPRSGLPLPSLTLLCHTSSTPGHTHVIAHGHTRLDSGHGFVSASAFTHVHFMDHRAWFGYCFQFGHFWTPSFLFLFGLPSHVPFSSFLFCPTVVEHISSVAAHLSHFWIHCYSSFHVFLGRLSGQHILPLQFYTLFTFCSLAHSLLSFLDLDTRSVSVFVLQTSCITPSLHFHVLHCFLHFSHLVTTSAFSASFPVSYA